LFPSVSIIIRTLNESRHLSDVLAAVARQDYPSDKVEVLLVDSGSTDGTLEIGVRHECRILGIRREEFSFGRSLNIGCGAAAGEVLVFVSGHCVPTHESWLSDLVRPLEDPGVGLTYGRQMAGPHTRFSEGRIFEKYFPAGRTQAQAIPFFCNNANAAVRRSLWERYRFDEVLTGLEDMQLARRLWESGIRIAYAPTAAVYHHHDERWSQVVRRFEREAIALQKIMPELHVHWHDALRYGLAGIAGDAAAAFFSRIFWRSISGIVIYRACQYYGVWKGNRNHRQLSRRDKEKYFYPS
jgi:rhamnosyltransferase